MNSVRDAMDAKGWKLTDLLSAVNVNLHRVGHEPVEYETVRRWVLPVGEPLHRTPNRVAMRCLLDCFGGELSADVFYPELKKSPDRSVSRETLQGGV